MTNVQKMVQESPFSEAHMSLLAAAASSFLTRRTTCADENSFCAQVWRICDDFF